MKALPHQTRQTQGFPGPRACPSPSSEACNTIQLAHHCCAQFQKVDNLPKGSQCANYKQTAIWHASCGIYSKAEPKDTERVIAETLDQDPGEDPVGESKAIQSEDDRESSGEEEDKEQSNAEEGELQKFRPIMAALKINASRKIAVSVRKSLLFSSVAHEDLSCSIKELPKAGTFSLVYVIQFSDGVEWVARIPGNGPALTELDAHQMDIDYPTKIYIKYTSVPLPEIYKWETICETIGAPCALMECLKGEQFSTQWFDKKWGTEEKRLTALTNIAQAVASLSTVSFDKIGALQIAANGQPTGVGEYIYSETASEGDEPWGIAKVGGPYRTVTDDLLDGLDSRDCRTKRGRSGLEIIRQAIKSIPAFMLKPGDGVGVHNEFFHCAWDGADAGACEVGQLLTGLVNRSWETRLCWVSIVLLTGVVS